MFVSARVIFRLTPLLDLLLIVIFAQYMEMREVSAEQERTAAAQAESLESAMSQSELELAGLKSRYAELSERETALARDADALSRQLQARLDELMKLRADSEAEIARARSQRDTVGAAAKELFQIPEETIEKLLAADPQDGRAEAELEEIRKEFRELAESRPATMVRHLLTYEELIKRCDIWEIHITEQGIFQLTASEHRHEFRASTADEFEREFFDRYKSLPQAKSLVIVLYSYGDARAVWREAATRGLPRVCERMREDSSGRSRFEYAVLGYQPAGAVIKNK